MWDAELELAITIMQSARHMVALTGAGISTESGIPDFRSPASGLWERYNPAEVASLYTFKHEPERFYDWIRPLAEIILHAEPNSAHHALARLETGGPLKSLITQNIDMLHTRAGSKVVHEVHGHLREATCIHCFAAYPAREYILRFLDTNEVPHCEKCGNVLKPNVILFGEQLPAQALIAARRAARQCDTMLVVGSSLEVYPAAELPLLAQRAGARLILINLGPTPIDPVADVVIHQNAVDILPQIANAIESRIEPDND